MSLYLSPHTGDLLSGLVSVSLCLSPHTGDLLLGLVSVSLCIVVVVFDHASCRSFRQYFMYCCCCLSVCFVQVLSTVCHVSSTMLCAGLVDRMLCIVVAVFDHALCGSCRQYLILCFCYMVIN